MPRKRKSELNLMKDNEFFARIAEKCNYMSEDLVREVYYEMIRLTSSELRHNGAIRYPSLGDFYIRYQKEKMMIHQGTGEKMKVSPRKIIKFLPDYKIKKYFASLS